MDCSVWMENNISAGLGDCGDQYYIPKYNANEISCQGICTAPKCCDIISDRSCSWYPEICGSGGSLRSDHEEIICEKGDVMSLCSFEDCCDNVCKSEICNGGSLRSDHEDINCNGNEGCTSEECCELPPTCRDWFNDDNQCGSPLIQKQGNIECDGECEESDCCELPTCEEWLQENDCNDYDGGGGIPLVPIEGEFECGDGECEESDCCQECNEDSPCNINYVNRMKELIEENKRELNNEELMEIWLRTLIISLIIILILFVIICRFEGDEGGDGGELVAIAGTVYPLLLLIFIFLPDFLYLFIIKDKVVNEIMEYTDPDEKDEIGCCIGIGYASWGIVGKEGRGWKYEDYFTNYDTFRIGVHTILTVTLILSWLLCPIYGEFNPGGFRGLIYNWIANKFEANPNRGGNQGVNLEDPVVRGLFPRE